MSRTMLSRCLATLMIFTCIVPPLYGIVSEELETKIICPCNCGQVLYTCQCGTSHELRETIKGLLDGGKSREEVLAYFEETYGEAVLAAPKPEGFNLLAWILPFSAVGLAGSLLCLILWRWSSQPREAPMIASGEIGDEYQKQVEADLKKMGF